MSKNIINEIKTFRKNSGVIKEDLDQYSELFNDIKKLIMMSSPEMKEKKEYQDLISFFKDLMPSGYDLTSGVIPSETDIVKKASSDVPNTVTNDDDFYVQILECLGVPIKRDNMLFFYAWRQSEGSEATNNPFNTTMKAENTTDYNSVGVKNYQTIQDGIKATCDTLKLSSYNDILDGLKNDVGLYNLSRMESLKKWGTGQLLAKVADGYLMGATPKPKPIMKGDFRTPETQNPDLNSPVVK
jgi:hypothetical protein